MSESRNRRRHGKRFQVIQGGGQGSGVTAELPRDLLVELRGRVASALRSKSLRAPILTAGELMPADLDALDHWQQTGQQVDEFTAPRFQLDPNEVAGLLGALIAEIAAKQQGR
jgi:hypothetical protein